ncbi:type II secretion system F family protein [Reyranella sp. CPCC 100927]|uniref:type II secretion system F family protein n=1 Tax=Reyranella sp. CPCC 100927 TaxID=2599616 RepID=UPI0011B5D4F3|nr:type II secretion system F family protein [Reyranella sp. CPCC 100927]TWT10219.1 type II secretion system F family protein [Reyranella sp. CPCC 100927]
MMDHIFILGLTGSDILSLVGGAAALIVTVIVWSALLPAESYAGRLRALEERRTTLKHELLRRDRRSRRIVATGVLRDLLTRFDALKGETSAKAQRQLMMAGFRGKDAIVIFLFLKMCLPMAFGLVASFLIYVLKVWELSDLMKPTSAIGSVLLGWAAPDLFLKNMAQRRRVVIARALPEGLDLLTICVEAGLGLDAALTRVAKELRNLCAELSFELQLTAIELTFLPDRQAALENLATRNDVPGIRGLVNAFRQTEKFGTPLAQSLKVLAAEFRSERMMKAEEKGARLPALLTVPLMVFILPTLFIVILGPSIISVIDTMK